MLWKNNSLKINVLFYMPTSALTGGPRVLINFLTLLDREKFTPFVILLEQGPLIEELKNLNVATTVLELGFQSKNDSALQAGPIRKFSYFFHVLKYNIRICQFIKENDINLVWARNIKAITLIGPGTKWQRTPLIWDIGLEKHSQGWINHLHNTGLWLADKIVTEAPNQPSQTFGDNRVEKYSDKFLTINPGISAQRIKELKFARDATTNSIQPSPLKGKALFNIVNIGTICTRKNQLFAIEAVAALQDKNIKLHLVGGVEDKAYMDKINTFIENNSLQESVFVYGWRNDIPAFMAAADVLLMTSTNEGIPYTVHEAMHIGLPAIVADAGGMAAAIIEGKTGYVFPINDIDKLHTILRHCLTDYNTLKQMGDAASNYANEHFSAKNWYTKYEHLFQHLHINHELNQ